MRRHAPSRPHTAPHRLLAMAAAACLLAFAATGCDRNDKPGQLGTPAPMFSVADGQHAVDLNKLRGKVVLLNFWAAWCAPCLEELPSMEQLAHTEPEVQIVGVSIDTDPDLYNDFLTRHHVDLLTVRDGTDRTNGLYKTYRPPETYVIDKAGIIRRKFIGPQNWTDPEIVDYLRKLANA